jgi:31-O-methyltransferase
MIRRVVLPNGLEVWAPNAFEAALVYREVFTEATYQSHGISLGEHAIVFDVGANVGLFAVHLARTVPSVQVHAFEPVPESFEALRRNLAEHAPGAHAHPVGLADREGEARFEVDRFMTITATMHPRVFDRGRRVSAGSWVVAAIADADRVRPSRALRLLAAGLAAPVTSPVILTLMAPIAVLLSIRRRMFLRRPRCRLTTLSNALAASGVTHVNLIKIDVEGAEEQVLAGIDDRDWPRLHQFAIEVHDVEKRLERLTVLLERRGYRTSRARADWALHELLDIWTLYAVRDDI